MAMWNVNVEYNGFTIEDQVYFPDAWTEEDVYQFVLDDILIDLTKED